LANENDIYLIAGLTEIDNDRLYNSSILINPNGEVSGVYRKRFLFGKETSFYIAGTSFPVFTTPYGKIGMMICYDRQKEEMIEKLSDHGAEIVFCPAGGGYGDWNDDIVSRRSREGQVPIVFVHPIEFLVTGPSGDILSRFLFGNELDENKKQTRNGVVQYYDLKY